jgi:cytochrome c-type biogenesis protein CcmH
MSYEITVEKFTDTYLELEPLYRQHYAEMVERLDARLSTDGSDLEGWLKLMRAYQVLGDGAKASDAFSRAKIAKANDGEAMAKLSAAAKELGIAN